jgi:hypothetical protein
MENSTEKYGEPRQLTAAEWLEEFNKRSLDVKQAADEWAVRWNEPEGKFISALLGATAMLGKLLASGQERMEAIAAQSRAAAEGEINLLRSAIEGANHVVRQGEFALRQARQLQVGVVVERQHLAQQMVDETLPMFAAKLKDALVIREQGWNAEARDRRYMIAAAISTALLLAGYSLCWWQDSGRLAAFNRCLMHPVSSGGQYYCPFDATLLGVDNTVAPPQTQNSGG